MARFLLWICIGAGGAIGSLVPFLWSEDGIVWSVILSTLGGIIGIWVWYKYLRYS